MKDCHRRCGVENWPSVLLGARLLPYVQKLRVTGDSLGAVRRRFGRSIDAVPVDRSSVIVIQACFVLAVDGCGRVPFGLSLIICRERSTKDFLFRPVMRLVQCGATSTFLSSHQFSGVDHQIAYRPGLIVDDEVVDVADRCVSSLNVVSADLFGATQDGCRPISGLGFGSTWFRPPAASKFGRRPCPNPGYPSSMDIRSTRTGLAPAVARRLVHVHARTFLTLSLVSPGGSSGSTSLLGGRDWRDEHPTPLKKPPVSATR